MSQRLRRVPIAAKLGLDARAVYTVLSALAEYGFVEEGEAGFSIGRAPPEAAYSTGKTPNTLEDYAAQPLRRCARLEPAPGGP